MTLEEFFAGLGKFVAYLGGASIVLLGLSGWIGKILSDRIVERAKSELQRELESHKASLRKSEFLFEKQYEAASEFIALRQSFLPAYRFPDMDWHDACEDMARNLDKIAGGLKQFVSKHAVVMKTDSVDELMRCVGIAEENQFGVTRDEVSAEAVSAVETLWPKLEDVERVLRDAVWEQSSTE